VLWFGPLLLGVADRNALVLGRPRMVTSVFSGYEAPIDGAPIYGFGGYTLSHVVAPGGGCLYSPWQLVDGPLAFGLNHQKQKGHSRTPMGTANFLFDMGLRQVG
jgi:hypothetical protein